MTSVFDAASVLDAITARFVVAVLRGPDVERTRLAVAALASAGVGAVEIAYTTPGATELIARLREEHPDVRVGAGTLRSTAQVKDAAAAGAEFLVSPGFDPEVAGRMADTGRLCAVGALTPTEVMKVAEYSTIPVIKLFPGSLGGPSYLKALRGPFPELQFMPTGGVTPVSLHRWVHAGAVAVGAGGELCPSVAVAAGDSAQIRTRASRFLAAARAAREDSTTTTDRGQETEDRSNDA
ncbi:2-dehydro-3-deoxyphosphogluconate aldolase/(4S)-4-hydroxy-2-oxoglutarate aldolase [Mumia flava]|uniref:2-dehydro-3-deoxyphosphogluconate aldolase/(4S)-4-hydroxy-2-oxoglutarate aldolase n=1 Tax=Mumia flava TaxID=1348852 RepID=A0A2M9BJJ1_9ACTN|nr:bifunctional 4-hydroxy-2-oxoglutarate aldolase/2-dehydro-3-deoxy-phosphogluconate aldolase [Mumia flava]PJJ58117.1 2-dehydro-3-deoxyphosphogluconate aldolase/(4S)-4-hydroxy-2-oxoglutarate aldolase [Mumia flava]